LEDAVGIKPPAEIQSLIDTHIRAFNTRNTKLFLSVFGDSAIIVDGIAPYRWIGPHAPAHWLEDVELWRKANGVVEEHISYEMGFWNEEKQFAYAVVSGTLTVKLAKESVVRTGTLAYTFAKHDHKWTIEAQAWGRTS
jgi:hypothetical protein